MSASFSHPLFPAKTDSFLECRLWWESLETRPPNSQESKKVLRHQLNTAWTSRKSKTLQRPGKQASDLISYGPIWKERNLFKGPLDQHLAALEFDKEKWSKKNANNASGGVSLSVDLALIDFSSSSQNWAAVKASWGSWRALLSLQSVAGAVVTLWKVNKFRRTPGTFAHPSARRSKWPNAFLFVRGSVSLCKVERKKNCEGKNWIRMLISCWSSLECSNWVKRLT